MEQNRSNQSQQLDNLDQHQDNVDQFRGNKDQQQGNVSISKRLSWGVVIQIGTLLVLVTIAYASLQTKTDAKADMEFNARTYMTKELSQERWKNNDEYHRQLGRKLDAMMLKLNVPQPPDEELK